MNEYENLVEDGQLDALGVIESGRGDAYPDFRIPGLPFHLTGHDRGRPRRRPTHRPAHPRGPRRHRLRAGPHRPPPRRRHRPRTLKLRPCSGLPLASLARPGHPPRRKPLSRSSPALLGPARVRATSIECSAGVERGEELVAGDDRRPVKRRTRQPRQTLKGTGGSQGHFTPAGSSISVLTPQCEMALGRNPGGDRNGRNWSIGRSRLGIANEGSFSRLDPTRQGPEAKEDTEWPQSRNRCTATMVEVRERLVRVEEGQAAARGGSGPA